MTARRARGGRKLRFLEGLPVEFINWLFGTREGVIALFVGGFIIAALVALLLERSTSKRFYNHEPKEGEEEGGFFDGLFHLSDDSDEGDAQ